MTDRNIEFEIADGHRPPLQRLQPRHDLLFRDRMLADPDAARVVNRVRYRSGNRSDCRFAESFNPEEPARLQAVNEDLCLLGWIIHDCRQPIREIPDTVVTCTWK